MKSVKIAVCLLVAGLIGCGGSGGGGSGVGNHSRVKEETRDITVPEGAICLQNKRNCSHEDVDLNAPVIWAADNGIKIVHIRWALCAEEWALKYAYRRGVTVVCIAVKDALVTASDYAIFSPVSIHRGIRDVAEVVREQGGPVLIVDNGFDHHTLYTLYKNTALAGEVTGDYGVKAVWELAKHVEVDVIGYVPFNTLPPSPRIDNWEFY